MRLIIYNYTDYITSDFRKIIKRCCKELCIKQDKYITIEFSKETWMHGEAYLGNRKQENQIINLWVTKSEADSVTFARLVKHELMHTLGVNHCDMTFGQRRCLFGSEWASLYPIRKA